METVDYKVRGMTCGHCVKAVTDEVNAVPGVESVKVDLDSGTLRVRSQVILDIERIREAVDEAGYELVS